MSDKSYPLAEKALVVLTKAKGSLHEGKVYKTYDIEEFIGCGHGKDGDELIKQLHALALERRPRIVSTSEDARGISWGYSGYCWALPDTVGITVEDHAARMAAESAKRKRR